jgi:hypothetical protein
MNSHPGRGPGPRPSQSWRARAVVVTAALAGLAPLAACGGSPATASGGAPDASAAATSASAVAYSQCMRSHGVPAYPDPDSSGDLPKITPDNESQLGVSDSRFSAAQKACQSLWPYQGPTPAQQRQELTDDLKFAQCMRSHGLPNFPDPTTSSGGRVEFVLSVSGLGINPRSPQVLAKAHECESVLPAGSGLPEATVAP